MKQILLSGLLLLLSFQFSNAREERLKFNLKFGFVKGGEAEMIIKDTVFNGQKAIYYYLNAQTTGLANSLYGVNDYYETFVDANTRLPLKSIRSVQEGRYEDFNETFFYHKVDSIKSLKSGWRKVPHNLLDIISVFFYYIHKTPANQFQSGEAQTYPTFLEDKISNVSIKLIGNEEVKTDIGTMDCFVLNPSIAKGKVLKRADGVHFYVSGKEKLPVLITFDMRVGDIKAVLKSYSLNGVEQAGF